MRHFMDTHTRSPDGRFIVALPKRHGVKPLGESRSQAIRRFLSLERSLNSRCLFKEVNEVVLEYFELGHAEVVPFEDFYKPQDKVFYLPIHVVYKNTSTSTKIRAVFDASAKSTSGMSLNDTLLVGPTVHAPLVDVLLRFRLHRIGLIADVKMYRAVQLVETDKDLHRFVWRSNPDDLIKDYRMTRVTFGVSASSFAANMSVLQNSVDLAYEFPIAAKMVKESFYVDDGLMGADTASEAIELRREVQELFARGGFLLCKWNSNDSTVLRSIEPDLREAKETYTITDSGSELTRTLGLVWDLKHDCFKILTSACTITSAVTKRMLESDIARIFDVLGWLSPVTIKMKILLQRLWETKLNWDEPVPSHISNVWIRWKSELPILSELLLPRCYFPKESQTTYSELHGFSDASEDAYAAVVYLRSKDDHNQTHVSLVMAKSRVAPIKRLFIPRLELCGAYLLTQLLYHLKQVLNISMDKVFAWIDNTVVLSWLRSSPRRFKTYVGNRVSFIVDCIPSERWRHMKGSENPADSPSRGLFPSELVSFDLWWDGPEWLIKEDSYWPT